MTTPVREELARRISDALSGRPVRWAQNVLGDYDGRERTLEIFNADAAEQRELFRSLRPIRKEMEAVAGGPVIVIFHTRAESARLYSDFVERALLAEVTLDVDTAARILDVEVPPLGTDIALHPRSGAPGTGSSELPRKAA
ncbi:MAG TPA: hypothetical protein VNO30_07315 [Kofleriaceae bacterium]|nr:hypothetical protein [Kofleriaceae bacterium]